MYVAFDSDLATKTNVQAALKALYQFLRDRGAIPALLTWHEDYQRTKWGVDDFLAQGHTLDELLAMIPKPGPLPARPPHGANGTGPDEAIAPDRTYDPHWHMPLGDTYNAVLLVKRYGQDLRYCFPWDKWLVWTGTHWGEDQSGELVRCAKATIKHLAARVEHLPEHLIQAMLAHIKSSLSTAKLEAMIRNAQSEPGMAVLPQVLDVNPWFLNCANGTLDLRTGALKQPHDRADLLTRCIAVAYDEQAFCPTWDAFLDRIMAGNQNLIRFLQRAIGYALTGVIREHVLLILWGSGRNGKSTFLNTIRALLAAYAMKATSELLMVSNNERHPTERADLFGKRFVAAIETEQGRRLAEVFVKEATGDDPIRARRMREDFWEFLPTHKIFLATNHKPVITGTDTAIWERVKLVPFTVTIPEAERDTSLPEKLQDEWPGILAWAVRGCLDWQNSGLNYPDEVRTATAGYQAEMDDIGKFLEEMCTRQSYAKTKSSLLHKAYLDWGGEAAPSQKIFTERLMERGYEVKHEKTGNFWQGIGLSGMAYSGPPEDEEEQRWTG